MRRFTKFLVKGAVGDDRVDLDLRRCSIECAIESYIFHDNRWRSRALSDQVLDRRIGAWPKWTKPHASECVQGG